MTDDRDDKDRDRDDRERERAWGGEGNRGKGKERKRDAVQGKMSPRLLFHMPNGLCAAARSMWPTGAVSNSTQRAGAPGQGETG